MVFLEDYYTSPFFSSVNIDFTSIHCIGYGIKEAACSLFKEDLNFLLPKNIDENDSIVLTRSIINSWAIQQLLLKKAAENTSQNDNAEINDLGMPTNCLDGWVY